MAKNNKNKNNKLDNNKKESKRYKNPANMLWGRLIIAFLAIAMCLSGLITVICLIIQNA